MLVEHKLGFPIRLFIYFLFCSSQFASSQLPWQYNTSLLNSTAGLSTSWTNRPSLTGNSTIVASRMTPILHRGNTGPRFLCGFACNFNVTECFFGVILFRTKNEWVNYPQLVWSANRDHPVNKDATLKLGQDGNLVLTDSNGTLVWSTNTASKSVAGLNLTEMGNLVLFDKRKRPIWQSFNHPTDSLLPGQNLDSGRKLVASISASNQSQGLFALTVLNGFWATYTDTDPPQYYYASRYPVSS
ncbi:hypothetical protein BC332_19479, partial [Capsicum chinense]